MGLAVYLKKITTEQDIQVWVNRIEEKDYHMELLYESGITHNLTEMAKKAGVYEALWRPYRLKPDFIPTKDYNEEMNFEDKSIVLAIEIIPYLEKGLKNLKDNPEYFKQFNPKNNWGSYDVLLKFVYRYLKACKEDPEAIVEADR